MKKDYKKIVYAQLTPDTVTKLKEPIKVVVFKNDFINISANYAFYSPVYDPSSGETKVDVRGSLIFKTKDKQKEAEFSSFLKHGSSGSWIDFSNQLAQSLESANEKAGNIMKDPDMFVGLIKHIISRIPEDQINEIVRGIQDPYAQLRRRKELRQKKMREKGKKQWQTKKNEKVTIDVQTLWNDSDYKKYFEKLKEAVRGEWKDAESGTVIKQDKHMVELKLDNNSVVVLPSELLSLYKEKATKNIRKKLEPKEIVFIDMQSLKTDTRYLEYYKKLQEATRGVFELMKMGAVLKQEENIVTIVLKNGAKVILPSEVLIPHEKENNDEEEEESKLNNALKKYENMKNDPNLIKKIDIALARFSVRYKINNDMPLDEYDKKIQNKFNIQKFKE